MSEALTVTETTDRDYLRRWLMRPSIVRKLIGSDYDPAALERSFGDLMDSGARFYAVSSCTVERGCIIFKPVQGGWEMHLCLATWFSQTRIAVRKAMSLIGGNVIAAYDPKRRAVNRLLDDLGFSDGVFTGNWIIRKFTTNPT